MNAVKRCASIPIFWEEFPDTALLQPYLYIKQNQTMISYDDPTSFGMSPVSVYQTQQI